MKEFLEYPILLSNLENPQKEYSENSDHMTGVDQVDLVGWKNSL